LGLKKISSYDIFAINIASTMLGYVYGTGKPLRALNKRQDLGVKVATPVGTLVGQLLFGYLADRLGRKKMCKFACPSSSHI
jgi:PHS family inorganic phosphate transporter-like MFS transporter